MTKEQEKFVKITEEYHNGNKQKAVEEAWEILSLYAWSLLHSKFECYSAYHEDMIQEAAMAVCEHLGEYNPTKCAPVTFFSRHILHGISTYINENINHVSYYYYKQIKAVREAEEQLRNEGKPLDIAAIASMTGLTPKAILKVNGMRGLVNLFTDQENNIEDFYKDSTLLDKVDSPETIVIQREKNTILSEALQTLPKREQQVIYLHFAEDRSLTVIGKEMGLTPEEVKTLYNRALIKLKDNFKLSTFYHDKIRVHRNTTISSNIVFAPIEESNNMMESIVIEDEEDITIL